MANNTSQHILSTAANLLGFCLFVITSIHISSKSEASLVDEAASVIAIALVFSCIFSFISIRTKIEKIEYYFEKIADMFFFLSLIGVLIVIVLIALKFI
jgi:hypothetical protein